MLPFALNAERLEDLVPRLCAVHHRGADAW